MANTIKVIPFGLLVGDAGVSQNSQEVLINMYAEMTGSGRVQIVRRQRPGLVRQTANSAEKRCIEKFNDTHYLVLDNGFYSYDGTTLTLLGNLATFTGRCTMVFNDNAQIMISDGTQAYWWNGTTLAIVPTTTAVGPLAELGGFGIFSVPNTGRFYITGSEDFSTVDPLDFATAEGSPDNLVRVFEAHAQLWLFGETTTEVWQLSGGQDFPFSALVNAQMERGCAAALSVVSEDNSIFFLGNDMLVYRLVGYTPVVISTRPVEYLISLQTAEAISNAYGFISTTAGTKVYTLTFPGGLTLQYNVTTSGTAGQPMWSLATTFGLDYWRVIGSNGYLTDYYLTAGAICTMVKGVSTDEDGIMQRKGVSAPGWADGQQIAVYEVFLDVEAGTGPISVTNPEIMMRCALDGETFGNTRVRNFGATGNYTRRPVWRNLGQGRKPVLEFSVTDPVEFSVMSVNTRLEVSTD